VDNFIIDPFKNGIPLTNEGINPKLYKKEIFNQVFDAVSQQSSQ